MSVGGEIQIVDDLIRQKWREQVAGRTATAFEVKLGWDEIDMLLDFRNALAATALYGVTSNG